MRPSSRERSQRVGVALVLVSLAVASSLSPSALAAARPAPGLRPSAPPLVPEPAYYRPVLQGGMTFPVARSNFLSYVEIASNWHAPRLRLIGGRWLLVGVHEGIDISGEAGTPILAMTAGKVENAGWTFYSGTRVGIRGGDGRYYFYAHFSGIAPGITPGARVSAGTVLGLLGNTGYGPPGHRDEFPPHLHFGIQVGAEWVNPYPLLVSLYGAAVRSSDRGLARLDSLAGRGRSKAWRREAARLFTDFGADLGE
jgi:murein DD-endopeptidase MepM/ murein hydrolase activator NlpD